MPERLTREACEIAAKWWSEFLTEKPDHDAGDTSETDDFTAYLEAMRRGQDPTPEQISTFVHLLSGAIWDEIESWRSSGWARHAVGLEVDYHPDQMLSGACIAAGISPGRFPWKTRMRLKDWEGEARIEVSVGRGAESVIIWPTPEETP